MKFQIISDIHIDYNKNYPKFIKDDDTQNLILAGDIGSPYDPIFAEYIKEATNLYKNVYFIAGNHEYYGYSLLEINNKLKDYEKLYSNFKYLQQNIIDIENTNIRLIGCTLWSKVEDHLYYELNDFKYIKYNDTISLNPNISRELHKQDLSWLENELINAKNDNKEVIVITHHGCSNKLNGIYQNGRRKSAFATDLEYLITDPIKAWICGHTHQNMILHINNVPIIVNCYGYDKEEQKTYIDNLTLDTNLWICN